MSELVGEGVDRYMNVGEWRVMERVVTHPHSLQLKW